MSSDPVRALRAASAVRRDVELIRLWMGDRDLAALRSDVMLRYAIERAFISIDAALGDIPVALLDKHGVPMRLVADFRNVLAQTYDDIMDARAIVTIRGDLPLLDRQMAIIIDELSETV